MNQLHFPVWRASLRYAWNSLVVCFLFEIASVSAQLLPPDAVDLSKVQISEHFKATDLCPVEGMEPDPALPAFFHAGVNYRFSSASAGMRFEADPERYLDSAAKMRWERNFLRSMSRVWCPVTDQVNPGGFSRYTELGLEWETCCQFCNPALVPDCFDVAEKRLRARAAESYERLQGRYATGRVSNPVQGALKAVEDLEGNLVIPKLTQTTVQNGQIRSLGAAPVEDERFDRSYGEWRHYGGDRAHNRFSSLNQINANTVHGLEIAW